MSYFLISYFALFLPIVIIIYQLVPQKSRWIVLLAADYVFFYMLSGNLIIFLIAATVFAWGLGLWIGKVGQNSELGAKDKKKKKTHIMILGILVSLGVLFVLKYFNFFGENIGALANALGSDFVFTPVNCMVPIGISYYTLQIISYLVDVKRGNQEPVKNFAKIAKEEGFAHISRLFSLICEIEKFHEKRYEKLLKKLETKTMFEKPKEVVWECKNCGYHLKGDKAPKECPFCKHPQAFFVAEE